MNKPDAGAERPHSNRHPNLAGDPALDFGTRHNQATHADEQVPGGRGLNVAMPSAINPADVVASTPAAQAGMAEAMRMAYGVPAAGTAGNLSASRSPEIVGASDPFGRQQPPAPSVPMRPIAQRPMVRPASQVQRGPSSAEHGRSSAKAQKPDAASTYRPQPPANVVRDAKPERAQDIAKPKSTGTKRTHGRGK